MCPCQSQITRTNKLTMKDQSDLMIIADGIAFLHFFLVASENESISIHLGQLTAKCKNEKPVAYFFRKSTHNTILLKLHLDSRMQLCGNSACCKLKSGWKERRMNRLFFSVKNGSV